jgi:hypothetical protein
MGSPWAKKWKFLYLTKSDYHYKIVTFALLLEKIFFCISSQKVISTIRLWLLHYLSKKLFFVKYRSRVYLKKIFDPSVNELEKKVKKK